MNAALGHKMRPLIYKFEHQKCINKDAEVTLNTNSWVYAWVDVESSQLLYVGEYGKSQTYDLITRLRRSIGELSHNTMNQLVKNCELTEFDIMRKLDVYCYQLSDDYEEEDGRKQVESWVNWFTVTNKVLLHPQYCGFSYKGVGQCSKSTASTIYNDLVNRLVKDKKP
jgi:hypothetical protein